MKVVMRYFARWAYLPLDLLWPIVILAGFGVYVSLVPQSPNDFWWHLKIGELLASTGRIPTTNLFAWTLPADAPFFYGAWLGELLLYVLYRWGGVALTLCARTVLALLTFWLMATAAQRRSGSWRIAALVLAFGAVMTFNNLIVRPQIWSWLPFMAFLLLLSAFAAGRLSWRWLLVLPLVMVFWVNAHGAFILGLVLLGIFGVGEGIRRLLGRADARSWKELGGLALSGGLSALATLVNPRGFDIVRYVIGLMTDPPSQNLIVEWQSPTPTGIANTAFYLSLLVLLLVLTYSRYRPTLTEALLLGAFLWLAWSGQRYVVWFALVAMPLLAQAIAGLNLRLRMAPGQRNWLNSILALLLFVPVLLMQPWFVEALPLPETYWAQVLRGSEAGPLVDTNTPVEAVAYLREHPGGHLFNEMGYGSYLIWALPEQGVFIDPRVELYPYEQWMDYIRIGQGTRSLALLEQYGVDRVLLDVKPQKELVCVLEAAPEWRQEYADDYAQVWVKLR
ncbi:MAG: hypothetical protein RBT75_01480 [Anaerolineae bacterium]|jgi:hypothetical protein|nr:hypothetical protein [Anaerolineae bacterium]